MEFMSGGSLQQAARLLSANEKNHVALCMFKGLAYLHGRGIAHGNVKPSNILLGAGGTVKLSEPDLSRTLGYSAPETFQGELGPESDIWSFGLCLYELGTGHAVFDRSLPCDTLREQITSDERPLIPESFNPKVSDLIRACWNSDKSKRPTVSDIALAFLALECQIIPGASEARVGSFSNIVGGHAGGERAVAASAEPRSLIAISPKKVLISVVILAIILGIGICVYFLIAKSGKTRKEMTTTIDSLRALLSMKEKEIGILGENAAGSATAKDAAVDGLRKIQSISSEILLFGRLSGENKSFATVVPVSDAQRAMLNKIGGNQFGEMVQVMEQLQQRNCALGNLSLADAKKLGIALTGKCFHAKWSDAISLIVAGAHLGMRSPDARVETRPLHCAAHLGGAGVARLLIAAGAEVNAPGSEGKTPLHYASYGQAELVKILLRAGAKAEVATLQGFTPLHTAAECGYTTIVKKLVKAGANIDARGNFRGDNCGWTPLHRAARKGRAETVKILIGAGANKDAVTSRGATPLHMAAASGSEETVRFLLRAGANKEARDINGDTPRKVATAGLRLILE
jgi:hypothetical protein